MTQHIFRILILVLGISHLALNTGLAQQGVKKDGRFTVDLIESTQINLVDQTGTVDDKFELLEDFDLKFQWWIFLGEPVEYYAFRWFDSDRFLIDGRLIHRHQLVKYPDLLKRFDNLRPLKINIELVGSFDTPEERTETPPPLLEPFYGPGTYHGRTETDFKYLVDDLHIMRRKSEVWGEEITPTSPRDWEYFLQYNTFVAKNSPTFWGMFNGKGTNNSEDLSEAELKFRRKQLEEIFKVSKEVHAHAILGHLEWPEYEMRTIVELYDKYESGETEPSPKEIVEEMLKKEVENLNEYNGDDFWGVPETVKEPRLVESQDPNTNDYVLKEESSGRVIMDDLYYRPFVKGKLVVMMKHKDINSERDLSSVSYCVSRPVGSIYLFKNNKLEKISDFHKAEVMEGKIIFRNYSSVVFNNRRRGNYSSGSYGVYMGDIYYFDVQYGEVTVNEKGEVLSNNSGSGEIRSGIRNVCG